MTAMTTPDAVIEAASQIVTTTRASGVLPVCETFFDQATNTATHVVHDPVTMQAAIIDSVLDFDPAPARTASGSAARVVAYVQNTGLSVSWVLETHLHADHLSAAPWLQERLGGRTGIGQHIVEAQYVFGKMFNAGTEFARDGSQFDKLFVDGDRFRLGTIDAIALHVPGHTSVDTAFLIGDLVFAGDTLFMPDCGTARTDFPGGDARALYRSIRRLLSLPPQTRLMMCHDYQSDTRSSFAWETTVAAQRAENRHVRDGISEDEFVAMREARDATLAAPRLILPSVQVNMRGGQLPPPDEDGRRYLSIPIDLF